MIIKAVDSEDTKIVDWLNDQQNGFRINNFKNLIIEKIIYDDNKNPIAYGIVKKLAEAILLINPEMPKITRAKAMRELMKFAEYGAKHEGCDQLHCFVKDEKLADLLESKFGFQRSQDIVLVKNL